MVDQVKPLRWMVGTLTTPPVGPEARVEAGYRLRQLQQGNRIGLPHSRPMPSIGKRVHELRIDDGESGLTWRVIYRIDPDAILIVHWFDKKTRATPGAVIKTCKLRLKEYDHG